VAVLLDKFITATVDMESEERQEEIDAIKKKEEVQNSLALFYLLDHCSHLIMIALYQMEGRGNLLKPNADIRVW
jgi:hypothetical protein